MRTVSPSVASNLGVPNVSCPCDKNTAEIRQYPWTGVNLSFTFVNVRLNKVGLEKMEKAFVVQGVATKLFATEKSVDAAILDAAELMAGLMQARRDAGVSAVVGDQAAVKLADAISALSAARSAVVACHHELDEVRLRLGVRTRMAGFEPKTGATLPEDVRQVG